MVCLSGVEDEKAFSGRHFFLVLHLRYLRACGRAPINMNVFNYEVSSRDILEKVAESESWKKPHVANSDKTSTKIIGEYDFCLFV